MKHQTNTTIRNERRPQQLRTHSTDVERILWQHLRGKQVAQAKFRRQHALGDYIVDFASLDAMLVVELDGGQHGEQRQYDERRDAFIRSLGFRTLRFWNNDVLENPDSVLALIHVAVDARASKATPSPP